MPRATQAAAVVSPPETVLPMSLKQLAVAASDSALLDLALSKAMPLEKSPDRIVNRKVTGLNHFNITASPKVIERVKRFYCDILGLTVGPRAQLDHSGYWLYASNSPILHLSACPSLEGSVITCRGFFNHISLSCVGLQATIAQLIVTETPYRTTQLLDLDQTQLFVTDPAGIGVELTFPGESL